MANIELFDGSCYLILLDFMILQHSVFLFFLEDYNVLSIVRIHLIGPFNIDYLIKTGRANLDRNRKHFRVT